MIERARYPGLEVSWLSRIDKQLPTPDIIYTDEIDGGGHYVHPTDCYGWVEDILIPPHPGTIIIHVDHDYASVESIMAHEWRHHWQMYNGLLNGDGSNWPGVDYEGLTYEEQWVLYEKTLAWYFMSRWVEMDALRHELKLAPCDNNEWEASLCRGVGCDI